MLMGNCTNLHNYYLRCKFNYFILTFFNKRENVLKKTQIYVEYFTKMLS